MKNVFIHVMIVTIQLYLFLNFIGCGGTSSNIKGETEFVKKNPVMPAVMDKCKKYDRVIIAGQPNEDECKGLSALGVKYVLNVRGYDESDNRSLVYFSEDSLLRTLDIPYLQMPISGTKFPYRSEVLDSLYRAFQATDGIILIHCTSGGRAAMVYAGYQVKYLNIAPLDAMRNLESYGMWPLPLEKLTGIPMKLEKTDKKE